jgi:hypothetical protein
MVQNRARSSRQTADRLWPYCCGKRAPDFFTTDTPTAVLVQQVLGAVSQFEKANLVAKLRAARERKIAAGGRGSGRCLCAEGAGSGRAGARATWAAPVAAADIKDARRAWASHWRRQTLHCDCGAEDASRIEAGA